MGVSAREGFGKVS